MSKRDEIKYRLKAAYHVLKGTPTIYKTHIHVPNGYSLVYSLSAGELHDCASSKHIFTNIVGLYAEDIVVNHQESSSKTIVVETKDSKLSVDEIAKMGNNNGA